MIKPHKLRQVRFKSRKPAISPYYKPWAALIAASVVLYQPQRQFCAYYFFLTAFSLPPRLCKHPLEKSDWTWASSWYSRAQQQLHISQHILGACLSHSFLSFSSDSSFGPKHGILLPEEREVLLLFNADYAQGVIPLFPRDLLEDAVSKNIPFQQYSSSDWKSTQFTGRYLINFHQQCWLDRLLKVLLSYHKLPKHCKPFISPQSSM